MSGRTTTLNLAGTKVDRPVESAGRLMSLDLFRGITIAAMILVNDPGDGPSSYWPLKHAAWNGWTPTDLVFPFFLFIVGVAMAFSFTSRIQRGESRGRLLGHVLWRGLALFALGVFLNGFPTHYDPAHLRIYGVLQRIAICYVLVAVLELWTDWRVQLTVAVACLATYWALMRHVSVPGYGIPGQDIPLLDPDRNLVAWLDRKLLMGHLYERVRDPEGLVSNIPALSTCLAGLLTGKWLRSSKAAGMKTQHRGAWTKPILVFGKNAIAAYFLSEAVAAALYTLKIHVDGQGVTLQEYFYSHFLAPIASPSNASLLYALSYVAICWLVMAVLYRKGIFLKI